MVVTSEIKNDRLLSFC